MTNQVAICKKEGGSKKTICQKTTIIPGRTWYNIGIAGNVGFIVLYVITRFPGNPINGRGGDVDAVDMICELAQVAYIVVTAVILMKERSIKVVDKEQLR